jgi:hypothetical protein
MLDTTRCLACPVNRVFAFPWGDDVHEFVPLATSPAGATSQSDCLADFSQMVDGAFFLDLKEGPEFKSADEPSTVGSFQVRKESCHSVHKLQCVVTIVELCKDCGRSHCVNILLGCQLLLGTVVPGAAC